MWDKFKRHRVENGLLDTDCDWISVHHEIHTRGTGGVGWGINAQKINMRQTLGAAQESWSELMA